MRIQSFIPQNPVIQNLVRCVFIIEQEEAHKSARFLILPSVSTYISVSLNTISYSENENIIVENTTKNPLDSSIQFGLKSSVSYEYRGKVKEICLVFNPLAVFDFFDEELLLKSVANNQSFIPDRDFETNIVRILNIANNDQIIEEIEQYLLKKYKPFSHAYLHQATNELSNTDSENYLCLDELARKFSITRQTLNNQCKKYLNLSASEFRQISRFRKFIQAKLIDENNSKLTDFVYDFGFFDQSHLIKEFRKYAFLKPNDFFRKVNFSKDNQVIVIWQ
ncbi:MAG: helix-turn-helix domain-containing protein [Pyrinomonadaceae bacterium]|nr:helix-turn-helix domain-containing protein [Pyrinomonadaceae bacterium]